MLRTATPYLRWALAGAVIGMALGIAGSWRETMEQSLLIGQVARVNLLVGAAIGMLTGLFLYWLRGLRPGGRLGHYLSWMAAITAAVSTVVLVDALASGQWKDVPIAIGIGVLIGAGIGLFVRQLHGHRW